MIDLYFAGDSSGYYYANPVYLGFKGFNLLESYDIDFRKNADLVIAGVILRQYFDFCDKDNSLVPDLQKLFTLLDEREKLRIYTENLVVRIPKLEYHLNEESLIKYYNLLVSLYNEKGNYKLKHYSKDKGFLEEEQMNLYLAGTNTEKDAVLDTIVGQDESNILISFEVKQTVDKQKEKYIEPIDKMNLYLAGAQSYGREMLNLYVGENNALFSFDRQADAGRAVDVLKGRKSKLFIDSGAFSAWTKGRVIDVDEYIKFINDRADYIYLYGQIDSIPGNRVGGVLTPAMVEEAAQKTWDNYLYMRPRMKNPYGLLYTFHIGEPFKFLAQALEYRDENGDAIPYIALGGMVGKPKTTRDAFMEKCFKIIKESSNPNVKVHAFGMTDFELLEKYPVASADSTAWIMTGATGMIMSNYGSIIVSDKQITDPKHYSHLPKEALDNLNSQIKEFGFQLEDLQNSRDNRIIYNAKYMMKRAANLVQKEYKPKKRLF